MYMEINQPEAKYIITGPEAKWDVERFDLSNDGKLIAYVKDEDGLSVIHVRKTADQKEIPLRNLPVGVVTGLRWHRDGHELGGSLTNARGPGDCYSYDVATGRLQPWTTSDTAGETGTFPEAEVVEWE